MIDLLVDTDVFSFIFKGDTRADLYRPHLQGNRLFLAFQTVAELYCWSLVRNWGDRTKRQLEQSIRKYCIVIPPDDETAKHWAQVMADTRASGHVIATTDAWIAATALRHQLSLVTHNRSHFEHVPGLRITSETTT